MPLQKYELSSTFPLPKTESLTLRFSPDGSILCVGGFDGQIRIYQRGPEGFTFVHALTTFLTDGRDLKSPITSLCFRPQNPLFAAKNVLLVTCSDGGVTHWHLGSHKQLHSLHESNEVNAADYSPDGMQFVTAGTDGVVRLYDDEHRRLLQKMFEGVKDGCRGHTSRIQAVKFAEQNIVVSGGWDYTMQIWDTRIARSVRSIYGPYICGDALDIRGDAILTGSCRDKGQLELWSLSKGAKIAEIELPKFADQDAPSLFCAKFNSDGTLIAAGGHNDFRVIDWKQGSTIAAIPEQQHCMYTTCWAPDDTAVLVAGADCNVHVFKKIE